MNTGEYGGTAEPEGPEPAERRGVTRIPDHVVSRIATHAAAEVEGVLDVRRRHARGPWGGTARASVHGDVASVSMDVSVAYPAPIRTVADELRRHVATRVHELTGLIVDHIDVDVAALVPGQRPAPPPREIPEPGREPEGSRPAEAAEMTREGPEPPQGPGEGPESRRPGEGPETRPLRDDYREV
ncbi:putative alkaline shock family protein YloU [Thermocatellispora tengchongensis]|uniref:Putative alkaline shock family protein YloU n=1 Tax=Thermocatellispora tengchongensis TaxID=1073253 RepID=A0A840P239_9ACTN|nr:Asp23/Gls24 family envelope stress response protein [Thermocatellispora tengchongensis]MBB5132546.1 putative alkaline shock family protein YloU [Thermocatellispora tengchongensis]